MIIGIPKEIKESEHRVGMTPSGVQTLIQNGHDVYVQNSAGQGSGHSDEDYSNVGAKPLETIEEVYDVAEMIIKVKEPLKKEYSLIKKGHQVYIVYPLIEESEKLDYKDLMDGYESILRRFPLPNYNVSIVHGKMKPEAKDYEMAQFVAEIKQKIGPYYNKSLLSTELVSKNQLYGFTGGETSNFIKFTLWLNVNFRDDLPIGTMEMNEVIFKLNRTKCRCNPVS